MIKRTKKSRVMYMHTLDGKPALFVRGHHVDESNAYIAFAGGSAAATLADSLKQIRREQGVAIRNAARERDANYWASPRLYGYVRVEIPA